MTRFCEPVRSGVGTLMRRSLQTICSKNAMCSEIDITFDFRSDTPLKKKAPNTLEDPETFSDTLRKYHKILWSKPLPNGVALRLDSDTSGPPYYLRHQSEALKLLLASDTVVPSFWKEQDISDVIKSLTAKELGAFHTLGYTIGAMMVWPANQVNGMMTINGARGCHPRIKDRFDLTVECIRRYYDDPSKRDNLYNPLGEALHRYGDFFKLFGDFRGFVDFFLLQDLVNEDYSAVNFHAPFNKDEVEFKTYPFPRTKEAYREYMRKASDFINARNQRILASICDSCI